MKHYNIDEVYGVYLRALENIEIDTLSNIKLDKLLFNDVGYSFNIKYKYIIKQLIIKLFTDYVDILKYGNDYGSKLLFTIKYNRKDHDSYWENFKKISGIKYEIEIRYKNGLKLNKSIMHDVKNFIKIFRSFDRINLLKSRIWLSIQTQSAYKIMKKLEEISVDCSTVFMFYDGGFEGNIVSQFYKQQGATTITLQHGQCLFRNEYHDRINQSVILNFISDYCLCKGEFAKKQFLKAGFDESRVLPLGNLDFVDGLEEIKSTKNAKKAFCVFLDTPSYPFYRESTKQLVDIANHYCKEYNFVYFIKPHPADKEKVYLQSIDNKYCKEILNSNYSLDEIGPRIDFSIFHASAIYADLLLRNIKSYKLETEVSFDIVLNRFDVFNSIDELYKKNLIWESTDVSEKVSFFREQNELYSNPYDVKNRYLNFIKSLDD